MEHANGNYHAPTVAVDRVVITEGIEVQPGVPLTIVTEVDPVDPISRDLASGVYPPHVRPFAPASPDDRSGWRSSS